MALGAGAVGALVAGSIVILRSRADGERLALTVHPSGVTVGGRF
jgi:hypothetical protein